MPPSSDDPSTPSQPWRSREIWGGTWVEVTDNDAPAARAERVVSVKMTEPEVAELDAAIAPLGLTRNRALRIAARRIGGFVEADPAEVEALRDAVRQLGGIARNVNQIARAANRTHDPDYRGFMEERAALGRQLARVEDRVQELLDLAARRRDGLARLEAAAGETEGNAKTAGRTPASRKAAKSAGSAKPTKGGRTPRRSGVGIVRGRSDDGSPESEER